MNFDWLPASGFESYRVDGLRLPYMNEWIGGEKDAMCGHGWVTCDYPRLPFEPSTIQLEQTWTSVSSHCSINTKDSIRLKTILPCTTKD